MQKFLAVVALAVAAATASAQVPSSYSWETKWFTQRLDHFDFSETRTFQQRYLINGATGVTSPPPGSPSHTSLPLSYPSRHVVAEARERKGGGSYFFLHCELMEPSVAPSVDEG
jgi:hypothetical protein